MKNDLATAIIVAIVGIVGAYLVANLFMGDIQPVSVKTVSSTIDINIANPDPEVFNYKAINPTVEVFVGNDEVCVEYDSSGNCTRTINQETPENPSDQEGE